MILHIDTTKKSENGGHVEVYENSTSIVYFKSLADALEFAKTCKAIGIIVDYIIIA